MDTGDEETEGIDKRERYFDYVLEKRETRIHFLL